MTQPYVPLQRVLDLVSLGGSVSNLESKIRNIPRVELNDAGFIPCSIPKELVDAIDDMLDLNLFLAPSSQKIFNNLRQAKEHALQGECTMHQSLARQQELEQAEELLKKVCSSLDKGTLQCDSSSTHSIKGLHEWWTKHKPKTEREKKLEAIKGPITEYFDTDVRGNEALATACAESILKALEGA